MTPSKPKSEKKKKAPVFEPAPASTARLVAERVGVSLMTVSRALNDANGVSKATRDKIRRVAEELGYSPNNAASALRRGSSQTIAMLLDSSLGIRGEYHSDSLAGFEQIIAEAGYDLLLMVPKKDEGIPGLIQRLVASTRCDAVVVRFDVIRDSDIRLMGELDVPLVIASGCPEYLYGESARFSSAAFDNAGGIGRSVRHLVSMGHQRIAYLGGNRGWLDADEREEGFRREMAAQNIPVNEAWIHACDFSDGVGTGTEGLDGIFSAEVPGPTAAICASDKLAAGALVCARKWGLSVPEDFSVIGFDNDSWGEFSVPPLTTIRQDGFEYGKSLGRLVLEEITSPEAPGRHVILDTPLVVRSSTAPPPPDKPAQKKRKQAGK